MRWHGGAVRIGTVWKGRLTFESPMLFGVGFLVTFLSGGLSGIAFAVGGALVHLPLVLVGCLLLMTAARLHTTCTRPAGP